MQRFFGITYNICGLAKIKKQESRIPAALEF